MLLEQDEKLRIADNMKRFGGSFVKVLADLINVADGENLIRIEKAFPMYIDEYADHKWDKVEGEE